MKVRLLDNFTCPHNTAVALGTFDGLHLGHRAVIESACRQTQLTPVVFSVIPSKKEDMLITPEQSEQLLDQMGVDTLIPAELSAIGHLSPTEFFETVLLQKLRAKHLVCGFNFRFGHKAAGDISLLKDLCNRHGLFLTVVDSVKHDGQPVSSSRIRLALKEGNLTLANAMLGRAYSFSSPVLQGQQLGRKLGFPTINQSFPKNMTLPKNGVYAVKVTINGQTLFGVCNVGRHPTVGDLNTPLAETHLLDFEGNLYGQTARLELIGFLRKEEKFPSLSALQSAIEKDVTQARNLLTE